MTTPDSSTPVVAVLMGSDSDWDTMKHTVSTLKAFGITCEARVMSAHRTPAQVVDYVSSADEKGIRVFIAAAGGAAHLAGVVAAHTLQPVIGVPMKAWSLDGLDSLLSTVQMPGGIPVATVAIGKAGAVNAAILAVQALALGDPSLKNRLKEHRVTQQQKVEQGDERIQQDLS